MGDADNPGPSRRLGTDLGTETCLLLLAGGATTALLAVIPGPVPLLIAAAIPAGTVRGNITLLQATAVPDRWGATSYGHLSGLLAAPATVAAAFARWAGAALAAPLGGYPQLIALLAGLSTVAALLALGAAP
ncbi:hypothetical protein [Actinacidiphila oryziradicis]|uniref:hypothetical protein n=1 Tax=Actinacidiphila oryziradicis TaxID=2571141 RepID=UPI001B7FF600